MSDTVLLLYGGKSAEHEISLCSAAAIMKLLIDNNYKVKTVGIDKKGKFHYHPTALDYNVKALPVTTADSKIISSLKELSFDVVFPITHGPGYEDGCLQGYLKFLEIPFVSSKVIASAIGMDKDIARIVAAAHGVKSMRYITFNEAYQNFEKFCAEVLQNYSCPVFVKPNCMGSSIGISKVLEPQDLSKAIKHALKYDSTILIEEAIEGREIELAVYETNTLEVSQPGELVVKHQDGFYSYDAKYINSNSVEVRIPAPLLATQNKYLKEAALKIFKALKCTSIARVDFFVAGDAIYFNEINTLPGFTAISMFPKLCGDNLTKVIKTMIYKAMTDSKLSKNTSYQ